LRLTRQKEEIEFKGEVTDTQTRKVVKHGGSYHVSLPMKFIKALNTPLLELKPFIDAETGEDLLLIRKPPKQSQEAKGDD
jgi:hypothetical protein